MFKQERLFAVTGLAIMVLFAVTLTPSKDSPRELYETAKKYERLAEHQRGDREYVWPAGVLNPRQRRADRRKKLIQCTVISYTSSGAWCVPLSLSYQLSARFVLLI